MLVQRVFLAGYFLLCIFVSVVYCTRDVEVIIVGGGMAGMAAARRLIRQGGYRVRVFEGRKDRYGGRIWTHRKAVKGSRGAEVELGALFLNTRARNNTLFELAEEFELPTKNGGSLAAYFPDKGLEFVEEEATDLLREVFQVLVTAVRKVKQQGADQALLSAVTEELDAYTGAMDRDILAATLTAFPTLQMENFSTLQYEVEADAGWDSVVVDGLDNSLDRIVSGEGAELPVKVDLNKEVRQIKIDNFRKKVIVRSTDRSQSVADVVIVAVPVGVIKHKNILFEPPLPRQWYKSLSDLGLGFSNKIILGFDEVFWPEHIGTFVVSSAAAEKGLFQMWTNLYRISKKPYLMGNIFGKAAVEFEKMSNGDVKGKALSILGEMFGKGTVAARKVELFLRSGWYGDTLTKGSFSYPKAGSTDTLWQKLREPVCPYLHFAGAHLESSGHMDSVHGAYNSGVQAAEQIISGYCQAEGKTSEQPKKAKKAVKKDEL